MKFIQILVSIIVAFSLSACGSSSAEKVSSTERISSNEANEVQFCQPGSRVVQACETAIPHALFATQTNVCNASGSAFNSSSCDLDVCQEGYEKQGNQCVKQRTCEPNSQQQYSCTEQIRNAASAFYTETCSADGHTLKTSSCLVEKCDTGFNLEEGQCVAGSIELSNGLSVSSVHPRVLVTSEELQVFLSKLAGPNAVEPFSSMFQKIINRELSFNEKPEKASLLNLALAFLATGDNNYESLYINALNKRISILSQNESRKFDNQTLISVDLMWDRVSTEMKLRLLQIASTDHRFYYNSHLNLPDQDFNYHGAFFRNAALIFAGIFVGDSVMTNPEVLANPDIYRFKPEAQISQFQANIGSENGSFRLFERRVAGDMTYNSALPGDFGGLYDNFSYDTAEEAASVLTIAVYDKLFNENTKAHFLHDKFRGYFYQNMLHPDGTAPRIWNSNISPVRGPNPLYSSLAANMYSDEYMQFFALRELEYLKETNHEYKITNAGFFLLFFDDNLNAKAIETNETSKYFSGPGFVTSRDSFDRNSPHTLFMSGEGISRRYTDTNSFILFHKEIVVPHAGGRFRRNSINEKHHYFHKESLSKNTIRVLDALESLDQDDVGNRHSLYSGPQLRKDNNFGGQITEESVQLINDEVGKRKSTGKVDSLYNSGDITKYENVEGVYTYSVGKGDYAYTEKLELFEREFIHLNPNIVIIFDRLSLQNNNNQRIWNMHTVYEPTFYNSVNISYGRGYKQALNKNHLVIEGDSQTLQMSAVLPEQNNIVIRGGESYLLHDAALNRANVISSEDIEPLDTGRTIEVIVNGSDLEGSITIIGDTKTETSVADTLVFDAKSKVVVDAGTAESGTLQSITDTTKNWKPNEFKGKYVSYNRDAVALITGNSENTLFGEFPQGWDYWQYRIQHHVVNTSVEYTNISSIETGDMDIDELDLRVLHYFDAVNAEGELFSFSPQSDGRVDRYEGQKELGRYNINVWSSNKTKNDFFLNVIRMDEKGEDIQVALNYSNDKLAATITDDILVTFNKSESELTTDTSLSIPVDKYSKVLLTGLKPNSPYYIERTDKSISLSKTSNSGQEYYSSDMGVIYIQFR